MFEMINSSLGERWRWWVILPLCGLFLGSGINYTWYGADGTVGGILLVLVCAFLAIPVIAIEVSLAQKCRSVHGTTVKPPLMAPLAVAYLLFSAMTIPPYMLFLGSRLERAGRLVATNDIERANSCTNFWNTNDCCTKTGKWVENGVHAVKPCRLPVEEYCEHRDKQIFDNQISYPLVISVVLAFLLVFLCNCLGPRWLSGSLLLCFLLSLVCKVVLSVRGGTLNAALTGLKYEFLPGWRYLLESSAWKGALVQICHQSLIGTGAWVTLFAYRRRYSPIKDTISAGAIAVFLIVNLSFSRVVRGFFMAFVAQQLNLPYHEVLGDSDVITIKLGQYFSIGKVWVALLETVNFIAEFFPVLIQFEVVNAIVVRGKDLSGKGRSVLMYRPLVSLMSAVVFLFFTLLLACKVPGIDVWYKIWYHHFPFIQALGFLIVFGEIVVYLRYRFSSGSRGLRIWVELAACIVLALLILTVVAFFIEEGVSHVMHRNASPDNEMSWLAVVIFVPAFVVIFLPLSIACVW